ncbi:MAG TPA: hypothetical protein VLH35_07925 [Candidatus Acidoferrales bacterium]|nr:hypothetical protein [Candidatus Acidoferrales bacterium]
MASIDIYTLIGTASLIIQIVVLILLFLGYSYKRKLKFRQHGLAMATAVVLHLVTILAIMIPSFALAVLPQYIVPQPLMLVSLVGLIHGITGIVAIVLGLYLVAAWGFRVDFTDCFRRKKIMPITLTVWLVALILGIILYAIFYGPLLFG